MFAQIVLTVLIVLALAFGSSWLVRSVRGEVDDDVLSIIILVNIPILVSAWFAAVLIGLVWTA